MTYERRFDKAKDIAYEKLIGKLGAVAYATESLDEGMNLVKSWIDSDGLNPGELVGVLSPAVQEAEEVIAQADPYSDRTSWNDYFRLVGRAAFAYQIPVVDRVFLHGNKDQRIALTKAVATPAIYIIDKALQAYSDQRATDDDRGRLRGVVNEFTKIALINVRAHERGKRMTLPSSQQEDLRMGIDSIFYEALPGGGYARTPMQTKSKSRHNAKAEEPRTPGSPEVISIYASDFHNTGIERDPTTGNYVDRFPISKLLVDSLGMGALSDKQAGQINGAIHTLLMRIRKQRSGQNTENFSTPA